MIFGPAMGTVQNREKKNIINMITLNQPLRISNYSEVEFKDESR